ncbi:hypothetical protein ZWY2020_018925 [Hordeum vulgare]|nr:hypothetical protein ZWY2020_018925 [Hordeum vulgare]
MTWVSRWGWVGTKRIQILNTGRGKTTNKQTYNNRDDNDLDPHPGAPFSISSPSVPPLSLLPLLLLPCLPRAARQQQDSIDGRHGHGRPPPPPPRPPLARPGVTLPRGSSSSSSTTPTRRPPEERNKGKDRRFGTRVAPSPTGHGPARLDPGRYATETRLRLRASAPLSPAPLTPCRARKGGSSPAFLRRLVPRRVSSGLQFSGYFLTSKKSKRRLFSGGGGYSPSQGNSVDGKDVDGSVPSTPSNSILEDGMSMKESSEHSCSSSVIDDEVSHSVEKRSIENWNSVSTSSNTSNTESDTIDGDYLRLLLEQKLRELTSGVRSPYSKPANGVRIYAPSPGLDDTASACDTSSIASTDYDRDSIQSSKDGKDKFPWTDLVSKDDQSSQSVKYDNDSIDQVESEHLHLSPHSTWEASLSTETCSSAESRTNANESRLFSSTEGAATSGSTHYDILDPHLFEELNGNFRLPVGEEERKSFGMIRRLLFDCVNEVLSVKCAYYFSAGYSSWFTGMAVLQKLSPEEIYQEMTSLKVAEEWMVDELVYKEMSGPLGSWVDFKTESHEAAKDITAELLESLVDEMVADLLYW